MITCALLLAAASVAAPQPVRNPFWPIGHTGVREAITADLEQRAEFEVKPAIKAPPAPKAAVPVKRETRPAVVAKPAQPDVATEADWAAALKTIRVGGRISARSANGVCRQSIMLDGRSYADGDLKSVSNAGRRFTWRVAGLAEGKPRLDRVNERIEKGKSEKETIHN